MPIHHLLFRRTFSSTVRREATYGFIGLGKMGLPMARNLRQKLPKDDTVYVYDVNTSATAAFAGEFTSGVEVAESVAEAVACSETVITMLPEPSHVASVFSAIAASNPPPPPSGAQRLFVDSSTIDIRTSLSTSRLVASPAIAGAFVDAPVSGGVVGASAGTLAFLVGCPPELLERVEGVLAHMGSRILHCGKPGAGLAGKLANNYVLAISNIAVAEAMNLGLKLGLDSKVLKQVINSSSGRCWASEVNNPVDNEAKGFAGGFGTPLMLKDLRLAVKAAQESGARLEMAERAEGVYQQVVEKEGVKDFSVVYKWLKEAK